MKKTDENLRKNNYNRLYILYITIWITIILGIHLKLCLLKYIFYFSIEVQFNLRYSHITQFKKKLQLGKQSLLIIFSENKMSFF